MGDVIAAPAGATALESFFAARGWTVFDYQRKTWRAYLDGASGLIHAPTGAGKTLAAWCGPVAEAIEAGEQGGDVTPPLRVLWLTPLRALANDTISSLREPVEALGLPWLVEGRTGDTSQSTRKRQREQLPTALVTTPESLSVLLSYEGAADRFASLRCVVVDEWHELLGSKRGVQTELCLARLRRLAPDVRTWGLSATLGNLDEALAALVGPSATGTLVRGEQTKRVEIDTLRPATLDRFPWSGHLGLALIDEVIEAIEQAGTTLLFTNTRSQTELWFQGLVDARPEWVGRIALHHGSLDRDLRRQVETMLAAGELRCVVCTSSLDLGVDFTPVDQVIQVGSPKGIARLLQRAGRSGHQPGAVSRVLGVPTNALDLVEFAAARDAAAAALDNDDPGRLEERQPLDRPLDVLAQHLVTVGAGDGFDERAMLDEVRSTFAYRALSDREWQWTIDFVSRGGESLSAYPRFARLQPDGASLHVREDQIARRHRMTIGTITSDSMMRVKIVRGATLGSIEERFIARLRPGDCFVMAGRIVELVRVRDMTAQVKPAKGGAVFPRWNGGRSPLSTQLADGVRRKLDAACAGRFDDEEMRLVEPLLRLQSAWSRIPALDELLIERTQVRGVQHVFCFTFAGRLVHEGLSALVAHRISRQRPISIHVSSNDHGFELASRDGLDLDEDGWRRVLSTEGLLDDLLSCLNDVELARRRFRGIAQIAGLVFPGFPGQAKTARQIQASSDLFYDVFTEFDPDNQLLEQARREVLDRELEVGRLRGALERLAGDRLVIRETERLSPMAFPLWVEQMRSQQVSSERWSDRVMRMAAQLEQAAAGGDA